MLFLIDYDRVSGSVITIQRFDDSERTAAENARLELELKLNRQGTQREVVLLEAPSEHALRRTHRRYFEDLASLTKRVNKHPVWDPDWAGGGVKEKNQEQIALGKELMQFGADLLLRSLSSAPDDAANHSVLAVLFRQGLVALDAVMIALEEAAVPASQVHLRVQMETRWGLIYALRDPGKWGRHIYVSSLREQRLWAARLVPGTPEFDTYEDSRRMIEAGGGQSTKGDNRDFIDAIDAILTRPENASINAEFKRLEAKWRHPAPWFFDVNVAQASRIRSVGGLARAVGCKGEYDTLYRHSSYYVHGGFTGTSLRYEDQGVMISAIRSPEGWRQAFLLSVSLAIDSFRRVIEHYRPGETQSFSSRYVQHWRSIIQKTPDAQVVIQRIVNR